MRICLYYFLVIFISASVMAQEKTAATPAVWNTQVSPTSEVPGRYPKAMFTPTRAITVTRIEGFTELGPKRIAGIGVLPTECPMQYALELSSGTITRTILISNSFLKGTYSTHTDSGVLDIDFPAGVPITLSLIIPNPQGFPAARCGWSPINVAVQYESTKEQTTTGQ